MYNYSNQNSLYNSLYGGYNNLNTGYNNPYNQMTQQQPQQQIQQPQQNNLVGQVISDLEVVNSINIPLDGSISYFPVSDGKTIVTKQLNLDGTVSIKRYELTEKPIKKTEYATKEEVDNIKNVLDKLLESLGGSKNDE